MLSGMYSSTRSLVVRLISDWYNVKTNDVLQLENNVEFHEFLEVHKSKSNKSAWVNDIILPASDKRRHKNDKSSDVEDLTAKEKDGTPKVEQKKKLSDLEASKF